MWRLTVWLAVASAGCEFGVSGLTIPDAPDLALADLSIPDGPTPLFDLAAPDFATVRDFALPDFAMADLATPLDFAMPDLTPSCNATPPPSTVGPGPDLSITLSGVMLNGGGNVALIAARATFTLSANYSIKQSPGCPNCIDQIIVGVAPDDPQTCLYDAVPNGMKSGSATVTLTAPSTPGMYTLRFHYAQAANCADAVANWWSVNNPPDSTEDFAALCVY